MLIYSNIPARSDGVLATVSPLNSAGMYLSSTPSAEIEGTNGGGSWEQNQHLS